jgi:D-alanyl-D-alanine carboxypeptidase
MFGAESARTGGLQMPAFASVRFLRLLAIPLCAALAGASAPPTSSLNQALRQNVTDYLKARSVAEHISALSTTISLRGRPPINVAVGTMKYGGGAPVTPASLFQIGSNTKAFTGALILRLEAAGKLSIDDTLGKWLPQYPAWRSVTIRRLLDMTSGIPTYDNTAAQIRDYENDPYERSTLVQLVNYVYPKIKKPAGWEYSNTGYILLQMIINKASSSHDYATELNRLIAASRLKNTFYEPYFYPPTIQRRIVSGYYVNTDPPALTKLLNTETSHYSLGWAQAAGGIAGTPEDLTIWVRKLFEGNVLPRKQLAEMESLVAIPSGKSIALTSPQQNQAFGLGIFQIYMPPLGRFWAYQGSTIGYRASYAYMPANGAIICVFTNSQTASKANRLNDVLVPKLYQTLKRYGAL